MKHTLLLIVCIFGLLAQASNAEPVKHKKLERKKWTLTESPNFRIVSDAKPKQIKQVAQQLERFRAFSHLLLGVSAKQSLEPNRLVITKSRGTWKALGLPKEFVSLTQTKQQKGASIFADIDGFTGTSLKKSNSGRATVFNALAYQMFQEVDLQKRVPFWYYRAFSQYLAGYAESELHFKIGDIDSMGWRLRDLFGLSGRFMLIDVLQLMSRTSYTNKLTGQKISKKQRAKFLAQAYVIVHYLYADKKRREQLSSFINTMKSGDSLEDRLFEAFGQSPEEFSAAVAKYAQSSLTVTGYSRQKVERLLDLPNEQNYRQSKMTLSELWGNLYPMIANLSDDIIAFEDKKILRDKVKQHLPKVESLFDQ